MTIWYVGRHAASLDWLRGRGIVPHQVLAHLDGSVWPAPGDLVLGNLPVQWIAALGERGVRYVQITLDVPMHLRGQELDAELLDTLNVRLQAFSATEEALPDALRNLAR